MPKPQLDAGAFCLHLNLRFRKFVAMGVAVINSVGQSLGYLVTAAVSASFGFAIGGMLAFSKVSGLYSRLNVVESHVQSQGITIEHLISVLRDLLTEYEASPASHDFPPGRAALAARRALDALIV